MATTSIVMIVRLTLKWFSSLGKNEKISQELRMRSKSLSEYQSLTLNVMTQVSQFVRNNQLCHQVTRSQIRSQFICLCLCLLVDHTMSSRVYDSSAVAEIETSITH